MSANYQLTYNPAVIPPGPCDNQANQALSSHTQQCLQEPSKAQAQATEYNQANAGARQSKKEKVLDGSIKAAKWLIWGDIEGKEARERKKREKKERKRKKRDDDGIEEDWVMEILEALV